MSSMCCCCFVFCLFLNNLKTIQSTDFRGSRELLDDSGNNLSASDSDSPVPTCMPFSWFGDSHKEPQISSSSLHFPQSGQDSCEHGQEKNRSKVKMTNLCFEHLSVAS